MNSKGMLSARSISAITILFGMVLLCFIWVGLYFKVQSERQMGLDNAVKETANYARTFEEHTVRTIRGLDGIAMLLKYQSEKEGLNIDLPRLVEEGRFTGQPYVLMSVVNENGDLVASNQVPFVFSNISDREHFLVHKEGNMGLYISKPVLGRSSGKWSIQLSRRINKSDRSFGGVVVVSVDPYYFAEFYKQVNLGEQSIIALLGRDGSMRVRQSGKEINIGMDFSKNEIMEKLAVSDAGTLINKSPVDGHDRIRSYRVLREYPLAVLVGVTEEYAFKDLNQRVVGYYWVCGAMSAVIVLFVSLLLVGVAQRKKLSEELACVNENLTTANETLYVNNEKLRAMQGNVINTIEKLRESNSELAREISARRQAEEQLALQNENLEFRISERTADLKKTNEILQIELSERKRMEEEILLINRLYKVLSQVNHTLVRIRSKDELYRQVCRIIVEHGGFKLAWIGENDPDKNMLHPVAWAGEPLEYVSSSTIFADSLPEGSGPIGTAIMERKAYICNDFFADPKTMPWRELAKRAGIKASAVFVFSFGGVVFGTLNVYADEPNVFMKNEVALLEELAMNISFGLEFLAENPKHSN